MCQTTLHDTGTFKTSKDCFFFFVVVGHLSFNKLNDLKIQQTSINVKMNKECTKLDVDCFRRLRVI